MTALFSTACKRLPSWYARHKRDLPWRRTRDPYPVWISEIMLQQTQVKTVLPRYHAWLDRFPDIATLATADLDAVLHAWQGLGYYRRARLLHAAAKRIMDWHCGQFPNAFNDILALPGIGRSTAGAIASFCFGARHAVLDGNVKRVLRRWLDRPAARESALWDCAERLIRQCRDPAEWNQAMMELGATVCRRIPHCAHCPLSEHCASAFRATPPTSAEGKPRIQRLHWRVHLHLHPEHGLWLERRPRDGIWGNLWCPPISVLEQPPKQPPCHIHRLTHRELYLYAAMEPDEPRGKGQWSRKLSHAALPTGIARLLQCHGLTA
ncbi:MAG: A/G-specific adenine glycosylase [Zetaproteobacteria bacterium]|nr:MAG: A/G-specific adenine glycosylase [Zetaproteobacteria bacterium]